MVLLSKKLHTEVAMKLSPKADEIHIYAMAPGRLSALYWLERAVQLGRHDRRKCIDATLKLASSFTPAVVSMASSPEA